MLMRLSSLSTARETEVGHGVSGLLGHDGVALQVAYVEASVAYATSGRPLSSQIIEGKKFSLWIPPRPEPTTSGMFWRWGDKIAALAHELLGPGS